MNPGRFITSALLILGIALSGCSHTNITNNGVTAKPLPTETRSNKELERLLPPSALEQKEFPKTYVIGMMRSCLTSLKQKNSMSYQTGKSDSICGCETDARVNQFTMEEYIEANQAGWDPRIVPDAAKKSAKIITDCLQKVLQ